MCWILCPLYNKTNLPKICLHFQVDRAELCICSVDRRLRNRVTQEAGALGAKHQCLHWSSLVAVDIPCPLCFSYQSPSTVSEHRPGSLLLCSSLWGLINPLPVLCWGDQLRESWIWSILGHFSNFYKGLSPLLKYGKCNSIASHLNVQRHTARSSTDCSDFMSLP